MWTKFARIMIGHRLDGGRVERNQRIHPLICTAVSSPSILLFDILSLLIHNQNKAVGDQTDQDV